MDTYKYESVEGIVIEIDDMDMDSSVVSTLTPTSKGVYFQWTKDSKDNLLVDGYFRTYIVSARHQDQLPQDINELIASYYLKSYSKRTLKDKMVAIKSECIS